ncbi:MAG: Fic family protein [Pseudomonadota bacterium]|nr:Fic family protein [Pseudomonadota bacterium]
MASPNELLAKSLTALAALQKTGKHVIRSADLSRNDRKRLQDAGFIQEVVRGWHLPSNPAEQSGNSSAWFAGMREFVAGYCNERFGADWHVSPDQSLMLRTGERTLPRQLQVWATGANNQQVPLPEGCSLFLYRAPRLCESDASPDAGGLRLATLPAALLAVGPAFFFRQPLAARIALASVQDSAELLRPLLDGGHVIIAGRLAGGMRVIGRDSMADEIATTMQFANLSIQETLPFDVAPSPLPAGRPESPYIQRLRLMWQEMRQPVIDAFPAPGAGLPDVQSVLEQVEERYVTDAYHSLSIEGYRVTADLIEKVRNGLWQPDGENARSRDAMAAKGYFEAHVKVKAYIAETMRARPNSWPLYDALTSWYRALFSPSVAAGVLKPSDLAGWRNDQVFIRGALHVPLSKETVRECMPVFFELLADEPHPAVRAVLGHFFFVYIHPYMDGNGRLGRFILNAMLVTGGYTWTIVPLEQRKPYMAALDQASSCRNALPLATFFADLVREQTDTPLPRPRG